MIELSVHENWAKMWKNGQNVTFNLKGLTKIFFKLLRLKGNLCSGGGGVTTES